MQKGKMMRRVLILASCLLVACGDDAEAGSGEDTTADSTEESSKMSGATAAHNAVRKNVQPAAATPLRDLVWSTRLAGIAQKHADKCEFEHSGTAGLGENLYASFGTNATPKMVVDDWASEAADYTYSSNSCASGKVCGHYTQVVWASTERVGCGATTCTKNSPFGNNQPWLLWVCNYDPPGNVVGRKPY